MPKRRADSLINAGDGSHDASPRDVTQSRSEDSNAFTPCNNNEEPTTIYISVPSSLTEFVPKELTVLSVEDVESVLGCDRSGFSELPPAHREPPVVTPAIPACTPSGKDNQHSSQPTVVTHSVINTGTGPCMKYNALPKGIGFQLSELSIDKSTQGFLHDPETGIRGAAIEPSRLEPIPMERDGNPVDSVPVRQRPGAPSFKMFQSRL